MSRSRKTLGVLLILMLCLVFVPVQASAAEVPSGTCGDNLTWELDGTTLTISGSGDMYDYGLYGTPWYDYCDTIDEVELSSGITSIGDYAFGVCTGLTSITIPEGVTEIGYGAFVGCENLTTITIPKSVTKISEQAVDSGISLTTVNYGGSYRQWKDITIGFCNENLTYAHIIFAVTNASGTCGDDLIWELVDGVLTISGSGDMYDCGYRNAPWYVLRYHIEEVVLPSKITSIGDHAFHVCDSLTNIAIPEGVTSIGDHAFHGCDSLTNIAIPEGVTSIGDCAFSGCTGLTGVTIPESVTSTGNYAFFDCAGLTGVTIPEGVISIGDYAFYGCTGLTGITIPNSVTEIGCGAFEECDSLTSVTIPEDVTEIGDSAFGGCTGLTSITIPEGVTEIGYGTFVVCENLTTITIPKSVTKISDQAFDNCISLTTVNYGGSRSDWNKISIGTYNTCLTNAQITFAVPFGTCGDDLEWELEDGVLTISGSGDMDTAPWRDYSDSIRKVVLNSGVTSVKRDAFSHCTSLTAIDIPESVTQIGDYAFTCCSSLISIEIPKSVTSIGKGAFVECSKLASIEIPDGITCIKDDTFTDCSALISVIIPDSVSEIGEFAFHGCSGLTSVTLPESVASIGNSAFSRCTQLASINIPKKIKVIDYGTFDLCTSLTSVDIPKGVISINAYAFNCCTALTAITIPDSVTDIAREAFRNCSSLTVVNIPNSVTFVGDGAFAGCDALTTVNYGGSYRQWKDITIGSYNDDLTDAQINFAIPSGTCGDDLTWELADGVLTIFGTGDMEDYNTWFEYEIYPPWYDKRDSIEKVEIQTGVTSIGNYAFEGCTNLTCVSIAEGVTAVGDHAFEGCSRLSQISLPDGVASIGDIAFSWCTSLEEITLPETTVVIGKSAFNFCTNLEEITISGVVTEIGSGTFCGCESLCEIVVPESVTTIGGGAFAGCTNLSKIVLPASVASFTGSGVFSNCPGLVTAGPAGGDYNIQFSWSDEIPCGAFWESGLTRITIPASVASIGNWAFSGCLGLESVLYGGTQSQWNEIEIGVENDSLLTAQLTCTGVSASITAQPTDITVTAGTAASFTVAASGSSLTYRWQWAYPNGSVWYNTGFSGYNTDTLIIPAGSVTAGRDGYRYRCVITSGDQTLYSDPAAIFVTVSTSIVVQPDDVTAAEGKKVWFFVEAEGTDLTYQWQYRTTSSGKWNNSSANGARTDTVSTTAVTGRNGYQYRCRITDGQGNVVYTDPATLTVESQLTIVTQPDDVTAAVGTAAKFTVKATGSDLTYQWQYKASGTKKWYNTSFTGNKTATLTIPAKSVTAGRDGYQYRCRITDGQGNVVYTDPAAISVKAVIITAQPDDVTAAMGTAAKFTVKATGSDLTYQWQYKASGTKKWYNTSFTGNKTATLTIPAKSVTAGRDGYQYRCKITFGGKTVYTDPATISVKAVMITAQPDDVTAAVGSAARFTVKASGSSLTYQWQWAYPGGSKWYNTTFSGYNTATLNIPGKSVTSGRDGYQYRCAITTNGKTVYTTPATITVR